MNKSIFILHKCKVNDKGHLEIEYTTDRGAYEFTSKDVPHPDLHNALMALNPFLADANELRSHRLVKFPPKTQAEDILKEMDRLVYESIHVSGLSLSGDEDHLAAVISGKHKVKGTAVAMNTPLIRTNGDSMGFETDLFPLIDKVREEVRLFIFEDKKFQSEIFKGDGEEKGTKKAKTDSKEITSEQIDEKIEANIATDKK